MECSEWAYACPNVNHVGTLTQGPSVADYPAGARMATRVIDDYEFVWMLRGDAILVTDGERTPLLPGALLLVPPAVRHAFEWDPRTPCRHGYVHFRGEREGVPQVGPARLRRMTDRDPLAGLCAYLIWLGSERPEGWTRRVEESVGWLLTLFLSSPLPGDEPVAPLPAPLADAVEHLRRVWSAMPLRRIELEELAAASHVSRSYLSRLFRAELGLGAGAALERLRCSRAEALLTRTDMTVGAVGRACGFADLYHFSHRFARRYGMPPTRYRALGGAAPSMLDHPGVRRLAQALWASPASTAPPRP
jgi:AraC family transcriptional regulator